MTASHPQPTSGTGTKRQIFTTSARLLEVGDFIEKAARRAKTLVVTNKPVRCALTGEQGSLPISAQYRGADVAHFGNLRGSNTCEGHDTVIILGRDEPSVRDAEQRAMAIWYDTREPIDCIREVAGRVNYRKRARRYLMRDGSTKCLTEKDLNDSSAVISMVQQSTRDKWLQLPIRSTVELGIAASFSARDPSKRHELAVGF